MHHHLVMHNKSHLLYEADQMILGALTWVLRTATRVLNVCCRLF